MLKSKALFSKMNTPMTNVSKPPTSDVPNKRAQPFLRWAGSKKKLLPELSAYYDDNHNRYIEPFVGSASLFFRVKPERSVLGDINQELISTYREIKYRVPGVFRELRRLKKNKKTYLHLRKQNPQSMRPAQRAARFIYLNRFCFNGIYRTNLSGQFNVPYSGEKTGDLPSEEVLINCARRLRNSKLIAGDFDETLRHVRTGDFVYMDPPFFVKRRRIFREYDGVPFSNADIHRLRKWMEKMDKKRISFVVSYAKCKEAIELAKGFRTKQVTVVRSIAGFTARRSKAIELIITNIPPIKEKKYA
jgi:DNA adenine methylase